MKGSLRSILKIPGLEIKGFYGIKVNYSEILSLDTISRLPGIKLRTNGYAFGKTLKGNFMLSDNSQAKLFIKKGSSPFIHLETKEINLYLNFEDPYKTVVLFDSIFGHWKTNEINPQTFIHRSFSEGGLHPAPRTAHPRTAET